MGYTYDVDGYFLKEDKVSKTKSFKSPVTGEAYQLAVGSGNTYYDSWPRLGTATYTLVTLDISNGWSIENRTELSSVE